MSAIILLFQLFTLIAGIDLYVDGVDGSDDIGGNLNMCDVMQQPCKTIKHITNGICGMLMGEENVIHFIKGTEVFQEYDFLEDCTSIIRIEGPDTDPRPILHFFPNATGIDMDKLTLKRIQITGYIFTINIKQLDDCIIEDITMEFPWMVSTIRSTHFKDVRPGVSPDSGQVALLVENVYDSTFRNFSYGIVVGLNQIVQENIVMENVEFYDNNKVFSFMVDISRDLSVTNGKFYRNEYVLEQKTAANEQHIQLTNCEFVNNTRFGYVDGADLEMTNGYITYESSADLDYHVKLYNGKITMDTFDISILGEDSHSTFLKLTNVYDEIRARSSKIFAKIKDSEVHGHTLVPVYIARNLGLTWVELENVEFDGSGLILVRSGGVATTKFDNVRIGCDCTDITPFECQGGGVIEISEGCELGDELDYKDLLCGSQACTYNGTMFSSISCHDDTDDDDTDDDDDDDNGEDRRNTTLKNLLTIGIVIVLFGCATCYLLALLIVGVLLGVIRCIYVAKKKGFVPYNTLEEDGEDEIGLEDIADVGSEDELELGEVNDIELLE